ncbi:ABC transporter substrate-binding protein [Paenibacillus apiarius]|uniref:ABC transporter substrate-binding protein n=1 Tax=Paenibacillus apiarius TaxID=46240 RepID=A0ABT4DNG6_9BACL|nr:ABC transporter substrate-binding protein [Paenibacillus apiarius]MCY9515498.1 ABC transporter substrate-binding protein [Paenibacillus apiarius]MCY9518907.1 ABC transporter substrate-binding protein [Paenibacillus apiarius]MCY9552047.1 ABC transporter substrate-binding protein [Paenibacillus apiarius]MCY9557277.1 ABC transporter substrate-binding protein [Paenibacillus apiarius]MCY9682544.1 ABC transporter substrate-binding protein [Paenibacillus apiarius]
MQRTRMARGWLLALVMIMTMVLTACGGKGQEAASQNDGAAQSEGTKQPQEKKDVKVVLEWTPNTNHTGLYVAKEQGFYEEEGLNVEIIQPGTGGADAMIASGEAQFGISIQEGITLARVQNVPLVSIAAIIQHNTSGFAAPKDKNMKTPKDFEGKTYGGWGSPVEEMVIRSLMEKEGADYDKVKNVNMGSADFFTAVKKDIDFAWIFYAWTGIEAELRNEPIDMMYVNQYSDKLDYYTPVIATNEKLIQEDPELIKAFMRATSKGYKYAIDKPEDAANLLLKAVPDLDKDLVVASQKWLSSKYQEDAARWGEQKREVWDNYMNWLLDHKLMEKAIDVDKAYTNDFLPSA